MLSFCTTSMKENEVVDTSTMMDNMFIHGAALFSAFLQSAEHYEGDSMDALDLPRGSMDEYETEVDDYDFAPEGW